MSLIATRIGGESRSVDGVSCLRPQIAFSNLDSHVERDRRPRDRQPSNGRKRPPTVSPAPRTRAHHDLRTCPPSNAPQNGERRRNPRRISRQQKRSNRTRSPRSALLTSSPKCVPMATLKYLQSSQSFMKLPFKLGNYPWNVRIYPDFPKCSNAQ